MIEHIDWRKPEPQAAPRPDLCPASWIQNGTMTIRSPSGEHRTLQLRTVRKGSWQGSRLLELLSGPDNTSDYKGFAFARKEEPGFVLFAKHGGRRLRSELWTERPKGSLSNDFEKLAAMLLDLIRPDSSLAACGYELLHEGRCLICNRKLTTPESIITGVGPVCAGR